MKLLVLILFSAGLLISCSESTRFRLITSKHTDIDFKNTIIETDSFNVVKYEYVYNGAGVGIGDLNNDGLQDIIYAGNQVCSRVYINLGNFKFKDITSNFAGLSNDQWYSGVAIADINSDGFQDVYFTSTTNKDPRKCRNRLWVNNGTENGSDPKFTEMAVKFGIADEGNSVHAAFFDYDLDGFLDLFILNSTFNVKTTPGYRQKINDGSAINIDRLYRNNGDGTFSDMTFKAGIIHEGFGLGVALSDINKDGYTDIYVSNDYISNDVLYINQGNGSFINEISKYLSYQSLSSMGNDIADMNNDGNPDILTLDMMPENYFRKKQTIDGFSYLFYINDAKYGYEHQYLRNMLHQHNGFMNHDLLPFSELGQLMGVYQTDWSWSPLLADFDNDGDKDLIVTNGIPRDVTDKDWLKSNEMLMRIDSTMQLASNSAPSVKCPNIAFENKGEYSFEKRKDWLPEIPSYSNGAAFVDLDNDGDLDYVTNNINDKAFVFRNFTVEKSRGNANYIRIKLIGNRNNSVGIGARIELWCKGQYQFTEQYLSRGYASSVDPIIHFGISTNTSIDSLKVTWPSTGNLSVFKNIPANQTVEIIEKNSAPLKSEVKDGDENDLLFNRCENIINYVHKQTDFIDFALNQKIIPHKFSQIGPCISKGDLNSDGIEDLIIGSTNILPTTVLLRQGNLFKETRIEGLTDKKEFSESGFLITDIDKDGDNDIIAIAGGYENKQNDEYRHYLYENLGGKFQKNSLPIPPFPASVILPFDYDHDGDQDLFVGARVKRGMFPHSNPSRIIINDNGKLRADTSLIFDIGMVTDAIISDYNNDGWQDIVIAREWNSLMVLKNVNGNTLVSQSVPGMENYHGIWYSIVSGDFDLDGDDDYIVGNLGDNNRFNINDKYPLGLYSIDINLDGTIDPIMTAFWPDNNGIMKEYPVNYFGELNSQTMVFSSLFPDYKSFSFASIGDILDIDLMKQLEFKLHVNTTSSYVIWNDKGNMRFEKLPLLLQLSPIKKMIVKDFNGDKYPDVLVGGNDYTYDVATGYYAANKGYILISNGSKQSFNVLTPSQTGILLNGMVESLLYLEGDTPLIVAGLNRSRVEVFKQNHK